MRLSGLSPSRTTLDNGAVFVVKDTHTTPAVAINLTMRAGSICDPHDAPGATWLLSRAIDRGTATRSGADIAEALDQGGISLAINVTRHLFSLVCTCLTEDFERVFALLGDILMAPSLPAEEVSMRKGEVITAIRQDDDNPAVRATEALMALLYPNGHPYGRSVKGSLDSVEHLTRERLARLHADRFAPGELTAVVVGDVETPRAVEMAARVFGGWRASQPQAIPLSSPALATRRQRLVIPMMNKAQVDIAYGFTTLRRADPAYYAFWLMNHVFGQYALGGRLGDSIRERQGMAYYVSSWQEANLVEGPLMIRAGVNAANVDRAVASIDEEVTRLVREGVTPKELDDSRQYLIGAMPRALETNAAIATFLQQAEFFGLGQDYDVRLPDVLRAVTVDDVNAVSRRVLDPERATLVVAGPYEDKPA
ncbi:MAG: pitrilysin family protein [Vicinamibacterales bacterium]